MRVRCEVDREDSRVDVGISGDGHRVLLSLSVGGANALAAAIRAACGDTCELDEGARFAVKGEISHRPEPQSATRIRALDELEAS